MVSRSIAAIFTLAEHPFVYWPPNAHARYSSQAVLIVPQPALSIDWVGEVVMVVAHNSTHSRMLCISRVGMLNDNQKIDYQIISLCLFLCTRISKLLRQFSVTPGLITLDAVHLTELCKWSIYAQT